MEPCLCEKTPNFHETNETVERSTFPELFYFLTSQNVPFGCLFICRKTLQLIVYILYYLGENTGKASDFQCFQI